MKKKHELYIAFALLVTIFVSVVLATPITSEAINGRLGAFTGPEGGADQDDNIKASLDLAHTDLDAIIVSAAASQEEIPLATEVGGDSDTYYVDSGAAGTASGLTWTNASVTLDAAIVLAGAASLADTGAVIYVAAGHAETLTAANQVDFDFAGIKAFGLGVGENRPTFTYTTNGEVVIGADDIEIHGFNFIAGNAVTHAIDVEAGFENYVINDCRFWTTTVNTDEFIDCIDIAAGSDNGKITNCEFEIGAASAVSAISHVGSDFTEISNNLFSGDYSTACIEDATTASIWMVIKNNVLVNGDTAGALNAVAAISLKADTSALVINNSIFCDMTEVGAIVSAVGFVTDNTYKDDAGSVLEVGKTYWLTKDAVNTGNTDDLFLVAGGNIVITHFFGEITTLFGGSPGDMTIELDSADNDYDTDFSTTVTVDTAAEGDWINFDDTIAESVLDFAPNVSAVEPIRWLCSPGTIEQTLTSTGSGVTVWHMGFIPVEEGVTVTVQ